MALTVATADARRHVLSSEPGRVPLAAQRHRDGGERMTRLIGLAEVARRRDISPSTLAEQVRKGTAFVMPCMGGGAHGRRYKFREADVERALATASLTQQRLRLARRSA